MSRFAPLTAGQRLLLRLTPLLAVIAAAAALPATASAAQYRFYACATPTGTNLAAEWSGTWYSAPWAAGGAAVQHCAAGIPFTFLSGEPGAGTFAAGTLARFDYYSPVPLVSAAYVRSVETTQYGWSPATPLWSATSYGPDGKAREHETCAAAAGCQLGIALPTANDLNWVPLSVEAGTRRLEFALKCSTPAGDTTSRCETNPSALRLKALVHWLEFVAEDLQAPTATANGGTAFANESLTGSRTVIVDGTDGPPAPSGGYGGTIQTESGMYEYVARIDGYEVGRLRAPANGGKCVDVGARNGPDFPAATPCLPSFGGTLTIDTTKVGDGARTLTVHAYDAAGNPDEITSERVVIDNVPAPSNVRRPTLQGPFTEPRPGDTIRHDGGAWSRAGLSFSYQWQRSSGGEVWTDIEGATSATYLVVKADIGKMLRLRMKGSDSQGDALAESAPTGAVKSGATATPSDLGPGQPGGSGAAGNPGGAPANGAGGNPGTAQLVVDREQRTVDVAHGSKIVITGRLVDADGQPIADAQVDVFEQLVLTAAPWRKIATVKTDSQGGYVFRPATTASRRLRFSYADKRDAADYRANREVLVSVQAKMTISAKRRVVAPRGVIRLSGRLSIDALPKTGAWVEVQVLDAGSWRTVATRKTSSKGKWSFNHRLKQSSGIAFRFRSRLRVTGDVAAAESKSVPVKVRVR